MDRLSAFLELIICVQTYCEYFTLIFNPLQNEHTCSVFKNSVSWKAPLVFSLYIPFYLARAIFYLVRLQQCQPDYLKVNACEICIGEKTRVLSTLHPTQKPWDLSLE